jgi:hypothetical protein
MERWGDDEAAAIIHPDGTNDEAVSEPPAAKGRGPARQLGWVPPSPAFLVRSALARRRLGRAGQSSSTVPPVRQ